MVIPPKKHIDKSKNQIKMKDLIRIILFLFAMFCGEMVFFDIRMKDNIFETKGDILWSLLFILSFLAWALLRDGRRRNSQSLTNEEDYIVRSNNNDS
ncbi:MAG: hypothetical protein HYV97_03730 [Bdellovibrio sp.]|nr:hypothetical protein [Bdellovibrio sp.]